ncbi:type II cytoskeletal 1-like [Podarcis lilfordi]|uniref:Type II cytoskeletal 1-like n=1 Tax=Podarcis lilfordi TaxID=74358 RepID=A0AA35PSB2_9SAUR|nr:type II cytoskeletal 1-like [Podarcis lilfordi]
MALCNYSCNSLCGVNTSCVSQIPPSQVVIQPPAFHITIPGPVMSASPEPVAVAGNTPCATGSCYEPCYGGWGGYGYGSRKWGSSSVCSYPYSRSCYKGCY